jgi:hypothetical protein
VESLLPSLLFLLSLSSLPLSPFHFQQFLLGYEFSSQDFEIDGVEWFIFG